MTTTGTGIDAQRLFDADYVLHIAKQSGVPTWIDAAQKHLLAADRKYRAALEASGTSPTSPTLASLAHLSL